MRSALHDLGRSIVFRAALLCLSHFSLQAQPENLPFRHLKSGVEIPATFAEFVFKDQQGYVWMGTEQGLARFNGQKMESFSGSQGLAGLAVTSPFFEDTANNLLWFSTDRAVNCYRRKFHDFKSVPVSGRPQLFYQDASHRLWVRTAESRVILLDPAGAPPDEPGRFRQTPAGIVDGATFCPGIKPDKNIAYLLAAYRFGNGHPGLRYYTFVNGSFQLQDSLSHSASEQIVKILPLNGDSIWLLCNDKLLLCDFRKNKKIREIPFSGFQAIDAIRYDDRTLLLATTEGIYRYNRDRNSPDLLYRPDPRRTDRLQNTKIQRLYLDRDSMLWASHWEGMDIANLKKVKFNILDFSKLNLGSTANFAPKSIAELQGRRFWFGSNFVSGLREINASGQIKSLSLPGVPSGFAVDLMYPLRDGQLLLSNFNSRSYWFDHSSFLPVYHNGETLPFSSFCQIDKDRILGGNEAGLFMIRKKAKSAVATAIETPLKHITTIAQAQNGTIFAGYMDQAIAVCRWQNDTLIQVDSLLVDGELKTCCETASQFWFGGTFGLFRCDKANLHKRRHYTTADGLPHNIIYGILEDSLGRLWMSTQKGLAMLEPALDRVHRFGPADGIQDWEFNTHAFLKDSRGQLWFGGMGGLNVFAPEKVRFLDDEPKIVLTEFNINYRSYGQIRSDLPPNVNQIRQIRLKHYQNNLYFNFTTLEYCAPENIEFQYQLTQADSKPNETTWTTVRGAQAAFTFSQLPPGKYKLHIKATNSDGMWLTIPMVMDIIIEIPFWQHPLFILFSIALAFSIGYWISNFRRQIEIDKLTAVNTEKDRIARDMHDDILKSFGSIRRNLEKLEHSPELLGSIIEQVKQVETDTRVVIDAFDFKHDSLLHTIYFTTEKLVAFIESENRTAFVYQPETIPDLTLSGRQRKNLYFAAQEAVNNAIKYSQSPQIHISFHITGEQQQQSLVLTIRDFGVGLGDTKINSAGFGMNNMMSRLNDIGGYAVIKNAEPEPGVIVTLVLPLKSIKNPGHGKN